VPQFQLHRSNSAPEEDVPALLAAAPLPEPFGQNILGAAADLHSLVKGRRIGLSVRQQVIPGKKLSCLRPDGLADRLETRGAALIRFVEVNHRRPGSLAAGGGVQIEIVAAWLERVRVRPELLPRRLTLSLQWLARL